MQVLKHLEATKVDDTTFLYGGCHYHLREESGSYDSNIHGIQNSASTAQPYFHLHSLMRKISIFTEIFSVNGLSQEVIS